MITYELHLERLEDKLKRTPTEMDRIVTQTAFRIENRAKQGTPLITGALRNSGYTKTVKNNGASKARADALAKNPKVEFSQEPAKPEIGQAIVGFAVEYAVYVELGTSRKAARPFLLPAVKAERQKFMDELKKETGKT